MVKILTPILSVKLMYLNDKQSTTLNLQGHKPIYIYPVY